MVGTQKVGTRSTEDTSAGAKRHKAQNGNAVAVKKAPATAKKVVAGTRRAASAKKATAAKVKAVAKAKTKAKPVKKAIPKAKKTAEPTRPKEEDPLAATPFLKARTAPVHELTTRADKRGTVYVFGNGDCGQLGLGEDMIERKKPFPVPAIASEAMVDVVSGGLHTVALTVDGRLWSWGCNDQKALGRDGDEFTAAPVDGLDGVRIVRVACSDSASFALAEDGHVYAWGTFRSAEGIMGFSTSVLVQARPAVINAFREPIVDLCAGVDHALALSVSGKVYAWGYGQQGQLGRLVIERRRLHGLTPERLRLLDVHHIGCGSYHSFAVTRNGTVYAWGLNNFHQLGLTPAEGRAEEVIHEPVAVSALKDAGIVKISGGEHHSIALAADGRLYAFGRSDSHQTGLPFSTLPSDVAPNGDAAASHKKAITAPTLVKDLPPVADFVCGSNHNIALTADGKAYSWGYGEMLQLGNGEEEDVELPTLVQGQKIDGKSILKVAAGGQHSAILAA
ncbi:hypothetical protein H4R24_002598 [Coemansia sp. RSA 988]|nr:hypothetical protein H4R24_002598 [Coemansia sp. RSA 988]